MAHRDDPRTKYEEERERIINGTEEVDPVDEPDGELIVELLDALDPEVPSKVYTEGNGKRKTLASNTLENYAMRLRMIVGEVDGPLLDLTQDDVNELMGDLLDGEASIGPKDGYASGTVGQFQCALKVFYEYHDGHEIDPNAIPVEAPEKTSIDERDMFEPGEVNAMRSVIDSRRNRAIFELLAYTGQRIRVIQTLRVKDVDPSMGDTGVYYVNEDVEGRKNREGKGPLLGAKEYVRRWLEVHPTKGEPGHENDALITAIPMNGGGGKVGEPLTQDAIRDALERIAAAAGVEKDVNPHIFRHYFTTIAKRDYGMDDAYIKRLRGDAPGSNVMETTYRHLSDADAVGHAEAKYKGDEPDPVETAHTPEGPCPTCGKILEAGSKACPRCGSKFTPDAVDSSAEELVALLSNASDEEIGAAIRERFGA